MSKAILHIGTHKTATTTIQNSFAHNASLLKEHGVIYPRLTRAPGHHGLVLDWPAMPRPYQLPKGPEAALRKLADEYAHTDTTVFLSSEEFSRGASLAKMGEMREILSAFDQIEVICVLRTQWEYLQSIYLEMSKKRRVPPPAQLVAPVVENGRYGQLSVDYTKLLDQLENAFSPQEITLYDFAQCRGSEGGILGVFLRHLGLDLTVEELISLEGGASNVSPMSLASWAANVLADPKVAPSWLVKLATDQLCTQYGTDISTCLFTRAEFQKLAKTFEDSNTRLAERRSEAQPGFELTAPDPDALTLYRDDIGGAFWMQIARKLVSQKQD